MIVDVDEFRYSDCSSEHKEQDKAQGFGSINFFFLVLFIPDPSR